VVNGESDKSNQFHWPDVKVEGVGADYRKSHPVAWWLALVGPVVISAALLGCIALIQGFDVAYSYAAAAVSAFLFLGRFIILIGQNEPNADSIFFLKHLTASNLFVMLTYMDTMVAMFVAFHMGIIFRLPWVGPRIQGFHWPDWIRNFPFFDDRQRGGFDFWKTPRNEALASCGRNLGR
jgi:hypothetical protein